MENELELLRLPGALGARLSAMNKQHQIFKRIYVMGCGRSGTWLLTGIMSTFRGVGLIPDELDVAYFGIITTQKKALVLKRNFKSYQSAADIPEEISLVHVVRHPFDVLTSIHHRTKEGFHISPVRWLGEMRSLRQLMEGNRLKLIIVRYEDMVSNPITVQCELASRLALEIEIPATDFMKTFNPPAKAVASMHGIREIDTKSVDRWRSDPEFLRYLVSIRPLLGDDLIWMSKTFGYDINF